MNETDNREDAGAWPTTARDVMTAELIAVSSDTPICAIARLLLENRISAVLVIAQDGLPIGMMSEDDLIGGCTRDCLDRYDWWLALTMGRQRFNDEFRSRLHAMDRTVRDVMTAALVTITSLPSNVQSGGLVEARFS
jgi:CBS-domain-containing membrane protein